MDPAIRGKEVFPIAIAILISLAMPVWQPGDACGDVATEAAAAETQSQKIARLIAQLGHDKYILREQAQQELLQFGAPALDALTNALLNDDIEIVMRTRYLLTAIQVEWAIESDPPQIRSLLKDYGKSSVEDRRGIMRQLAATAGAPEIDVLCRMVRFEKSHVLSKWAALLIIGLEADDEKQQLQRMQRILQNLEPSARAGAGWLKTLVRHHGDAEAELAEWKKFAEAEQQVLAASTRQSSHEIVQGLLLRVLDLLGTTGRKDEEETYIRRIVDLQPEDVDSVKLLVDRLAEKHVPHVLEAIAEKHPKIFNDDPLLLYALAYARKQLGKHELAQEAVDRALQLNPNQSRGHLVVAFRLQQRGWFEWSEQEYRKVIETDGLTKETAIRATFLLSEMLHDEQQEKKAGEAVAALVKLMDTDPRVRQLVQRMERKVGSIKSRMNFFFSLHHELAGESKKQREYLQRAVGDDPHDADVLIALYRLPKQSPEEKANTLARIRESTGIFRKMIEAEPDESMGYNQFAWLVGNTLGETDKALADEAIRYSEKSLELRPDSAGYLDTLGRCYYARGNYKAAVKTQGKALKLDPHSGLIRRQFELFEKALAEAEGES